MLTLARTTDKLQAFLAGAAATTNPTVTVVFYNLSSQTKEDNSDYPRDRQFTVLSGTTETDILAAPLEAGKIKHVECINVFNADTASVTVTIAIDDNGTNRILVRQAVASLETLVYEHGDGWHII